MKKITVLILCCTFNFLAHANGLLKELSILHQSLINLENKLITIPKSTLNIFEQLDLFDKKLDLFAKNSTEIQLQELILQRVSFENIEKLTVQELKKLRMMLARTVSELEYVGQIVKNNTYVQKTFYEEVFGPFKQEKENADKFIGQKIREFQKTLFDQLLDYARNQLIKVQNDPSIPNLSNLANALTFDMRFLDVIDNLNILFQINMKFNQLAKDIKSTFNVPNNAMQAFMKRTGRAAWVDKFKNEIFNSLQVMQQKMQKYLNMRREVKKEVTTGKS